MEIKPVWLMEGMFWWILLTCSSSIYHGYPVAPHYFKAADLEQLAQGDKKMPKTAGASSRVATSA